MKRPKFRSHLLVGALDQQNQQSFFGIWVAGVWYSNIYPWPAHLGPQKAHTSSFYRSPPRTKVKFDEKVDGNNLEMQSIIV